jgi:type IV conjugative transfer system coupling protein TraD
MKRSFGNFTRGSQLIETFGLMFAAGLKPMLWVVGTLLSVALAWLIWRNMAQDDLYRCVMRGYAWLWEYLKFDAHKLVAVTGDKHERVKLPISVVPIFPPVQASWRLLIATIVRALEITALIGLPACLVYTWVSHRIGNKALRRNHERGATRAPVSELIRQVNASNREDGRVERNEDYRRLLGPLWWLWAPFARRDELIAAGMYLPYTIAGVPYPWRAEQTHMFAVGTTGTGKSTMMRELAGQIRERGGKAVIFDLTGAYIESFYDPERDTILNPFDIRCPQWSIFNDCDTRAEFTAAAEALIPNDGGGGEPFWIQAARLLLIEACVRLKQNGKATNKDLHDHLMVAALHRVHQLMQESVAAPLTDPAAARMAESIRAVLNTNINAIECLPKEGKQFSIKQWVRDEPERGSFLFIAARHVDLSTIRVLLTLWMDTAINTMMSLPPSPRNIRIWFLFDEIAALHRLSAIEKGMQTARNFGGAFVLGVHTIAKLRETYGDEIAETLGSLARTKLILATADYTSAQWCSQQIGNGEWRQMEEGYSYGYANVRDAVTLTNKRQLEPLVLPDDIAKLPDLAGWLVYPQGFPAAQVKLRVRKCPRVANPFEQRPDVEGPYKPLAPTGETVEAPPDEGRGMATDATRMARYYGRLLERDGLPDPDRKTIEIEARRNVKALTTTVGVPTITAPHGIHVNPLDLSGATSQLNLTYTLGDVPGTNIRYAAVAAASATAEPTFVKPSQLGLNFANRSDDDAPAHVRLNVGAPPPDDIRPHEMGSALLRVETEIEDLSTRELRLAFEQPRDGHQPEADTELGL